MKQKTKKIDFSRKILSSNFPNCFFGATQDKKKKPARSTAALKHQFKIAT